MAFRLRPGRSRIPHRFLLSQHGLQQFVGSARPDLNAVNAPMMLWPHEQVADGVQHFVTYEFVFETQTVCPARGSRPPRWRNRSCRPLPATDRRYSMSRINPKVRRAADLTHERLSREIKAIALRAGVDSRVVEIDGEVQAEPLCGDSSAHLSPSSTRTVSFRRRNFFAEFSSSMPASSSKNTNDWRCRP